MAQIIIAQIIQPGTPVVASPLLFSMDMQTTATLQSPVEVTLGRMAAMQLFTEGYGIPSHTYGSGTDSFILDGQSMIERTSIIEMVALSGAAVLGGAGQIETAKTISPIQLIIDNDIFGMTRRLKEGLLLNEETLAWKEIMEMSADGEAFIAKEHTFRHFREIQRPNIFTRDTYHMWNENGRKDLIENALDYYQSMKEKIVPSELPEEVTSEMNAVLKKAHEKLVRK